MLKKIIIFLYLQLQVFGFVLNDINFDRSLQGGHKDFKVFNDSKVKLKYRVTIESIGEENIGKYIQISPKVLTINPGDYAVVKLAGRAPKTLEEKEYEFMLNFKPVVIPTLSKINGEITTGKAQAGLVPRVKMSAYSGQANYKEELKLKSISFRSEEGKVYGKIKIENTSKGSVALVGNFYDANMKMMTSKFIGRVGAGTTGEREIELPNVKDGKDIKTLILRNDDLGDLVKFTL
ncbi:hypothetical protein [Cetobacterium sp.]|uniref:hypothetical protein n=1 Tax=Cetobacterium sp. TaxID=2071632 RepID=UPI003EE4D667